jgi:hypothetical protein
MNCEIDALNVYKLWCEHDNAVFLCLERQWLSERVSGICSCELHV